MIIIKERIPQTVNCWSDMEGEHCKLNKESKHFFRELNTLTVNVNDKTSVSNSLGWNNLQHLRWRINRTLKRDPQGNSRE